MIPLVNCMERRYYKKFESLLHRPVDPFRKLCIQNNRSFNHNIENDIEQFFNNVKLGMRIMKRKKIVVTGLIYNAESQVSYLRQWFETLKTLCLQCHIVIVENNSIDDTRLLLENWQKENPTEVHLVCNTFNCNREWIIKDMKSGESDRIEKMAFLRNLYQKYIKLSPIFTNFDYVLVKDFDLRGSLFWDGLFDTIQQFHQSLTPIDAIACNGILNGSLLYYDSFAFARDISELRWTNHLDKQNHDEDVLRYIAEEYQKSQELDKVSSAFGGFCVYNFNSFTFSKYGFEPGFYTCEHCIFHETMRNFYVNPNMVFLIEENIT